MIAYGFIMVGKTLRVCDLLPVGRLYSRTWHAPELNEKIEIRQMKCQHGADVVNRTVIANLRLGLKSSL